ncbi:MAG: helix-turn-helix domain-containing protein [Actinoallomurus sp.]
MQQHMATALFGVDGVEVVEVDVELCGEVTVWLSTGDRWVPVCPGCGTVAGRVHERVVTRPRDLGDRVAVVWLKRRWKCGDTGCGRVTFTESVPQIPSRARLTERLREQTAALIADQEMSVAAASRAAGVSWPTAHQAFTRSADQMPAGPMAVVDVLGIDETRRGRPRWHKDPDTGEYVLDADRWHTGFVDVSGGQGMLGQVEGRTADDASYWLHQAGPA